MDFRWSWRSKLGGRLLEYEINYKIDELSIYLVIMNVFAVCYALHAIDGAAKRHGKGIETKKEEQKDRAKTQPQAPAMI